MKTVVNKGLGSTRSQQQVLGTTHPLADCPSAHINMKGLTRHVPCYLQEKEWGGTGQSEVESPYSHAHSHTRLGSVNLLSWEERRGEGREVS